MEGNAGIAAREGRSHQSEWRDAMLREHLRRAFPRKQAFGFADFLDAVLYHPDYGYYGSACARIGKQGDFFTNVSVGEIFGAVLAEVVEAYWVGFGKPMPFFYLEQGAHDGMLMRDFLHAAKGSPDFWNALRAGIIEPQPAWRARQQETIFANDGVAFSNKLAWFADASEVSQDEKRIGFHFSNELLDALPFAVVRFEDGQWLERKVQILDNGELRWESQVPSPEVLACIEKLPAISLLPGEYYETEIRPCLVKWGRETCAIFEKGIILICDYGYPRPIFYRQERNRGTLQCYHAHRKDADPFSLLGSKDISAHVDFTAVAEAMQASAWEVSGFTDQHHFLVGAIEGWLRSIDGKILTTWEQKRIRRLQTLLHPETMGTQFRYLAATKGWDAKIPLPGFSKASDAAGALFFNLTRNDGS